MNKKRDVRESQIHHEQKGQRKSHKMGSDRDTIQNLQMNDPHLRDKDDGNGEYLGGRI